MAHVNFFESKLVEEEDKVRHLREVPERNCYPFSSVPSP
jgi:hypothetical protein